MVGHEKGDNNFAANPFINYVNGFARKEDFENKLHSRLTILDDFKPWQNGEDLKNVLTAQSTGLNIKTGTVKTPPLPCILITNSDDQFKAWKADKDYQKDCVFLEVDGWFYINPSQKRTIRNCKLTQNFSSEEVLRMEVEALEQQRIDESNNQLNTTDLSDNSLQAKYRVLNAHCSTLFRKNDELVYENKTLEAEKSSFQEQFASEFKAMSDRIDALAKENSSVMKQVDELKEENSSFMEQANIQADRIESLEEQNRVTRDEAREAREAQDTAERRNEELLRVIIELKARSNTDNSSI